MDEEKVMEIENKPGSSGISEFTESYASFNRIINSLQRKYIDLKDEFSAQNEELVKANKRLVALTEQNLNATQFLNSILTSISVGVIAVDQNGTITHFNPASAVIMGIPVGEAIGRQYRDIIPPGQPFAANALRTAETSNTVDSVEKKIVLDDETQLSLSVSTSVLFDEQNRLNGAVEVFTDLTKVKKMEQELARLNTMAALGEMAATIAHEVRNPLAGIAGFASLLERDIDRDDPRRTMVKKIIRGVDKLNDTVTSLLNYTKMEELNKSKTNYISYLQTILDDYKNEHNQKLKDNKLNFSYNKSFDESPLEIDFDRLLMRQVYLNIITNALEVSGDDGSIDIKVVKLPRQVAVKKYSKRLLLGVDETVVETLIKDNGPGIKMEHLDHIFAPFFTTKQGGNGLGLAISWRIVKAHGGDIVVESSSKKGTEFRIILPVKIGSEQI